MKMVTTLARQLKPKTMMGMAKSKSEVTNCTFDVHLHFKE